MAKRFRSEKWSAAPSAALQYGVTLGSVALALNLKMVLDSFWQSTPDRSLFFFAIMFSAWFGGLGQGLLAIALSGLAYDYFFLPPIHTLAVNSKDLPSLIIFVVISLLFGFIAASQKSTSESLRRAQAALAEAVLQRTEAYLSEAQRLSHTGSFGWTVSTGEILWSEETFRIFQYDPATKPTVQLILDRVPPEDRDFVKKTIERASEDGEDFDCHHRLRMPDGTVKHVHVVARGHKDASGDLEFIGAIMDVTQATETENKIRLIINTVPGMLWTARPDGWVDFLNERWLGYTGMTAEKALGWGWEPAYWNRLPKLGSDI